MQIEKLTRRTIIRWNWNRHASLQGWCTKQRSKL